MTVAVFSSFATLLASGVTPASAALVTRTVAVTLPSVLAARCASVHETVLPSVPSVPPSLAETNSRPAGSSSVIETSAAHEWPSPSVALFTQRMV